MKNNLLTLAVVILGACVLLGRALALPFTWWRAAGMALFVPALILFALARWQLGSSFSVTAQARQLVTAGVYSRIRNPIYVFGLATLAGAILWSGWFWLLLVLIPIAVLQVARARKEARVLEEHFGDQYRQYRARTWF